MKNTLFALVLLLSVTGCEMSIVDAVMAPSPDTAEGPAECRVLRVVDGDTFTCRPVGDVFGSETVRLLAIDAPEQAQATGPHATAWLRQMLPEGTVVRLRYDREVHDRYDRLLAWVVLDDVDLNRAMVWEGMAVALIISPNTRYALAIQTAESVAYSANRGLWAMGLADCPPADFRAGHCST